MPIGCFSSTHEQTDISSFTNNLYICLFELWKSKDLRPLNTGYIYDTLNIIGRDTLRGERRITKAFNVMTSNVVAARQSTTAREIGARLLLGDFNGLPVIDSNAKVIGIVTAVDILRAIRQGKNLDSIRAIDIMTRNPMVVKQDTEVNEIIDIILQKAIILVPVVDDERKLIGVVGRLDILQQNLNEKFVTIGERSVLSLKR